MNFILHARITIIIIILHSVKGMIICIKNIEINKKKLSDVLTRLRVLKEIFYDNGKIVQSFIYLRNVNATNFYAKFNHVFFSKV